jgi:acyl carrier protein
MPVQQTPAQSELAQLIVKSVNLEDTDPATIDPDAPLFGAGLGLDSIDALEIALEIAKRYGVQLKSDDENNKQIFASLRTLCDHLAQAKTVTA